MYSSTYLECKVKSFAIGFSMMNTFILLAIAWFCNNFTENVFLGDEVKRMLTQGLDDLVINIKWIYISSILLFALNFFFITNQMFWHKLLDSSWCNCNCYNREKVERDNAVTD